MISEVAMVAANRYTFEDWMLCTSSSRKVDGVFLWKKKNGIGERKEEEEEEEEEEREVKGRVKRKFLHKSTRKADQRLRLTRRSERRGERRRR
jgi:hypothetical protein